MTMTDAQAREIVTKYKHLIMKFANRAARRTRLATHDVDDFFSIGAQAALKAVTTFDPAQEVPEIVWVTTLVRRHIEHEVRLAKRQGLTWVDGQSFVIIPLNDDCEAPDNTEARVSFKTQCQWVQDKMARLLNPFEQEAFMGTFTHETGDIIGARRGVSKQRVDQLKRAAIEKLTKRARFGLQSSLSKNCANRSFG
jgi:RNA polymerase sigma factor (sigma-70 family)